MTVIIRKATLNDANLLVQVIDMASGGVIPTLWAEMAPPGMDGSAVGLGLVTAEDGDFSYRNGFVAESGGTKLGGLIGYALPLLPPPAGPETPEVFVGVEELVQLVPGHWYINVMATMPAGRRQGVGTALLSEAERQARALSCPGACIDCGRLERDRHQRLSAGRVRRARTESVRSVRVWTRADRSRADGKGPDLSMRAVVQDRYGSPEHLRLADIPVPEPRASQIRVRVLACGVNLSDWEFLVGSPFYARLVGGLRRPKRAVLGSDIVGIVEKLGAGITGFETGDRVMGDLVMHRGGFAEYACVAAGEMTRVPDAISDEIAACLPQPGGIAVAGTEALKSGDKLLINGAGGGSGTMALQLAKARGVHVTAVDNAGKIDWLRSLGADEVIDYRVQDFTGLGRRWNRILDMVATRGPSDIARCLSDGGRYEAVGGSYRVLMSLVIGGLRFRRHKKSIGMLLVPSGRELTERVGQMVVEGKMYPHLEAVLPLSSVPEALKRTGLGDVKGKLVIRP